MAVEIQLPVADPIAEGIVVSDVEINPDGTPVKPIKLATPDEA